MYVYRLLAIMTDICLAIVGSRDFDNFTILSEAIDNFIEKHGEISYIVSGGAKGADSLAEKYAKINNIKMKIFKPDWKKYGKAAGIIRNKDIVDNSTHLIAFRINNSRGTTNSIMRAQKKKMYVKIYDY